jgi:hypothetical protein
MADTLTFEDAQGPSTLTFEDAQAPSAPSGEAPSTMTFEEGLPVDTSKLQANPYETAQLQDPNLRGVLGPGTQEDAANVIKAIGAAPGAVAGYAGNVVRGGVADVAQTLHGDEKYYELNNLAAAALGETPQIDDELKLASGEAPAAATMAKVSQGAAASIPLMAAGMPAGVAGRLISAGFAADMIRGGGQAATDLGTELGKNPEDRDPDKITSAVSDLVQAGAFAPLAGAHAVPDKLKATAELSMQLLNDPTFATPKVEAPTSMTFEDATKPAAVQTPGTPPPGTLSFEEASKPTPSPSPAAIPPIPVTTAPPAETATAPVSPAPAAAPVKLLPVDVSDKDVKAMRGSVDTPPDVLDTISDHFPNGVQFDRADQGEAVRSAQGRAAELMSHTQGEPADQVLQGLHAEGLFKNLETPDDLAQAMVQAGQVRLAARGNMTAEARQLAEEQARTVAFESANKASRPGVESVPIEQLFLGDTVKIKGQPMTVVEHPVDADTGKPFGVTLEGAYGRQTLNMGSQLHIDAGSLKEGEMVGMGAAVPSEFHNTTGGDTGIKKAAVAQERQARGEAPLAQPPVRSFPGDVWQGALAKVADNPSAPLELVNSMLSDQVEGRKRALTDDDVALLLHRHTDLNYQRAKLVREQAQVEDDAKQFPNRADELPRIKGDIAKLDDQLDALEKVMAPAATETARGLAALRAMVQDNYSLARMERVRTKQLTDIKGRDLTAGEHADMMKELLDLRAKMKDATEREAKAKAADDEERSKAMADAEIAARIEQVKNGVGYDRQVHSLADRIVTALEKEATAARARLKAKFARFNTGLDPTLLTDLATVGAAHIARGTLDFTRWSKAMVADFGENVIPWLNQAWTKANARVDTAVDRLAQGKQSIEVKKRIRKDDVTGQRKSIIAGLKDAATEQRPLDEQGDYIRKLMENFIVSGLKEREPLVDAIHKTLTDDVGMADVTRRDVREAMANYGKFKALNPDEIKAKRRDLSHQIAQTLKLEDIQARRPLPRSGVEQHTPSTEGRLLQQQVNEAKRRFGVVVTDAAKQLKGALEARKTWLNNRIADLKYQIAAGARSVKTKTPGPADAETKLLQIQVDTLKQQLDEIAPRPGMTDAQRAALAERSIQKEIEWLEKQIAAGQVSVASRKPLITSARLDALRARRVALRAQWDELRSMDPQYQKTLEERAIKSYVARLTARAADYADRTARGDFAPRQVKPAAWKTSPEVIKAFRDNEAAKQAFHDAGERARLAARSGPARVVDGMLAAIRAPFAIAIYGHGTVGMITHAGGRMFLPSQWGTYWRNFGSQWKLWTNKDYHDRAIYKLVNDPDYDFWRHAGAAVDPHSIYTDYGLYAKWGGKFGAAGKRGFDALKIYRLEANKAEWAKVPESIKNDPQQAAVMARNIAQMNNHATGVANLGHGPLTTTAQTVMFAAKLEASRWARIIGDPAKTIFTFTDWHNANAADRQIAVTRLKHAAEFGAFYFAALLANQGINQALGTGQKVNLTDPTKSDWLKFKAAHYTIALDGGLLAPVRFLGHVIAGDLLARRTKMQLLKGSRFQAATTTAGQYARGKFSPTASILTDVATRADYAGRPLPFTTEAPQHKNQTRYTLGEYLWSHGPIPLTGAAEIVYNALRQQGMSGLQASTFIKALAVAAAESTGAHVNEDLTPGK